MRIALAQINPSVGDLEGNAAKVIEYTGHAVGMGAELVVFPEMVVVGYPPEDLLLKPGFITDNLAMLKKIAASIGEITAVVGFVDRDGGVVYNAAAIISSGKVVDVVYKSILPTYGVFDESRYFAEGKQLKTVLVSGIRTGITICEDIWCSDGPAERQVSAGKAGLLVNISASPYSLGKKEERLKMLSERAGSNCVPIVYTNMVGGQDELLFDGGSMVLDGSGRVVARAESFREQLLLAEIEIEGDTVSGFGCVAGEVDNKETCNIIGDNVFGTAYNHVAPECEKLEEIYNGLLLGVRDYFSKNRFTDCLIGLSGGIDSALTAKIAVDALGRQHVTGLFMPSRYTSPESREDTDALVENLGIICHHVSIDNLFENYLSLLSAPFDGCKVDATEENLQARIRGNIMMAFSNKFGWIVLTTGNKSEMSVGYATLYGDMAGGFAVLKDVYKTKVYELSEYVNLVAGRDVIPVNVIKKAPTAELREEQTDQDSLPPYDLLDTILKLYIEADMTAREIVDAGYSSETVYMVTKLVDVNEYKRRQAPVGIRITEKAFGKDRRLPVTNRYR